MTVQPSIRISSASTEFRLPQVDWKEDRRVLARPHRRLATAKLRREWLIQKYGNETLRPRMTFERSKTFISPDERQTQHEKKRQPTKTFEAVSGANNVWQNDIMTRQLPERIPIVRPIRIHTAPPRTILTDTQRDSAPLFRIVPRTDKTEQEKERGRMHFINREWPSEKISWVRLYQNVPEIHRRSWMQ